MKRHSPLKAKPLRNPGQSLQELRDELLEDKFAVPVFMAIAAVVFAGLEWWRAYAPQPPQPVALTLIASVMVGYAIYSYLRIRAQLAAFKLGIDGEKVVGQFLERLRSHGYSVFHDIVGKGFNVDHVLIGPAGVFTIETKTYSKAPGPDVKVHFDGVQLTVDGVSLDRDPIVQGKAQADWLRTLLEESTGRRFLTRSVILFPGWYVEQEPGTSKEVWVLEPKALPGFLNHEPEFLSAEDIKLASFHLSRFVRAHEAA